MPARERSCVFPIAAPPLRAFFYYECLYMGKSPAFRLYASDFDMDTNTWTNEEIGLYVRLLLSQWVNGPLPKNPKKLGKIGRISSKKFQKVFPGISHKFHVNGDGLIYNERLEKERVKQANYLEKQREHGKKSAENRWKKT